MNTDKTEVTETVASDLCGSIPPLWLNRWSKLIIALYGLLLLGIGLGSRTLTQHEVFAAYPAKEMLRYGHWIVQMFAGIPRTAKPPTTGWLIAVAMFVTRSDAEWVARVPAMLSGILTALIIASFAARFLGNRIGLVTGLIQLTCFYTLMQARLAEADMLVCAAVTGAMCCFGLGMLADAAEPATRLRWLRIGFYACAGAAFLLKAVPILFILLAVAAYGLFLRERRVWRFLWSPVGIALLLAMILGWPLAAYLKYPAILKSWRLEVVGTASGELNHDPFYFYVHAIPGVLMPWTPLMALGVILWARQREWQRPLAQFLLCWTVPGILALQFSVQKHKHYPIPMLPPMSIAGAIGLVWLLERMRPPRFAGPLILIFGITLAIVAGVNGYVIPRRFDDYRPIKDLALAANAQVPERQKIYIIDAETGVEPQIAYYLRPPIWRFRTEADFEAFAQPELHRGVTLYVIATEAHRKRLEAVARVEMLADAGQVRKREPAGRRQMLLRLSAR